MNFPCELIAMNYTDLLNQVIAGNDLSEAQMSELMQAIMTGRLNPAQIAAALTALAIKEETADELTAAARVMRQLASSVDLSAPHLIDIVGTGGDRQNTFNVSTTACFVVAACGGIIAKHGNRSVSSKSGSADLLESAGVNINLTPDQVRVCIQRCGLGFMFAPRHHQAMKHAIDVRRSLGIRTIFNLLGPLTNPANADIQLIGVYHQKWLRPFAEVLLNLGSQRAMVVHSNDGLDEISITAETQAILLRQGTTHKLTINPQQYGCAHPSLDPIRAHTSEQSLHLMHEVLSGQPGAAYDIVLLNAAAALYCAQICNSYQEGIDRARKAIDSGNAMKKLTQLIELTQAMQ